MNSADPAIPNSPLTPVRISPSRKNWKRMLRLVAPIALRSPISRVRSLTETSMMLMIPTAPSASVTIPTPPRNTSIAVKILPTICSVRIVSHSLKASGASGSKPCRRAMIWCTCFLAIRLSLRIRGWYWIDVTESAGMFSPLIGNISSITEIGI